VIRALVVALWAGCSPTPEVASVTPASAEPGDLFEARGVGLEGATQVAIVAGAERRALSEWSVEDGVVRGKIPADLAPGDWVLEVVAPTGPVLATSPIRVVDPTPERACAETWTANTMVSVPRGEIRVERFFPTGQQDDVVVAIGDVAAVEYDVVSMADGRCSVVWLRRADGRRVAFDRSIGRDLDDRARRLAADLDVPLVAPSLPAAPDDDGGAADADQPGPTRPSPPN
jgi:hypothetical protein